MSSTFQKKLLSSSFWSFFGQISYVLILLISNIFLARVLGAEEFGKIGIVMFFVSIANVLSEGGLAGALVRLENVTKKHFSTVFVFNLVVSLIIIGLLLLISGYIGAYYNDQSIANYIRYACILIVLNSLVVVQNIRLIIDLNFRVKAISKILGAIMGSAIAIYLAERGFGALSLIIMQIILVLVNMSILMIYSGWFFSLNFDVNIFKKIFSFGINTTLSNVLTTVFDNIYQLILGKYFSINQVGYFYQGKKLQELPTNVINLTLQSAIYSSLSKVNNKDVRIIEYKKIFQYVVLLSSVLFSAIFLFSKEIVLILLGEKWENSIIFVRMLSVGAFFFIGEMFFRLSYKLNDQTKVLIRLDLLKKAIQLVTIIIGIVLLKINVIIGGIVVSNVISFLLNFQKSNKIMSIKDNDMLGDFFKIVLFVLLFSCLIYYIKENFLYDDALLNMLLSLAYVIPIIIFLKVNNVKKS